MGEEEMLRSMSLVINLSVLFYDSLYGIIKKYFGFCLLRVREKIT